MPIDANGVRTPSNQVPLWERKTLTLVEAAKVWNVDYDGLRLAVLRHDLATFRPPNRDGNPGRRHVTQEEMRRWIRSLPSD